MLRKLNQEISVASGFMQIHRYFSLPFYSHNNPSPSDVISTELHQGGDIPSIPNSIIHYRMMDASMNFWEATDMQQTVA